jgi:outer membrane lipopolysaccharide assembly protein LptE/RlpB
VNVKKSLNFALTVFLTGFILSNCGYYSFKGTIPPHLKSIAIPIFVDRSGYPGVQNKVSDAVTQAFIADNTFKLVDESRADIILNGTIQSVDQKVAAVKPGETVAEYQMVVSVKVVCEDINQSKKMYEKVFREYGTMSSNAGQDEKDQAIDDAIELITESIISTTLGGW